MPATHHTHTQTHTNTHIFIYIYTPITNPFTDWAAPDPEAGKLMQSIPAASKSGDPEGPGHKGAMIDPDGS